MEKLFIVVFVFLYSSIMFWDIRMPDVLSQSAVKRQNQRPYGVSDKFKHLNHKWKPLFRVLHSLGCNTVYIFTEAAE